MSEPRATAPAAAAAEAATPRGGRGKIAHARAAESALFG